MARANLKSKILPMLLASERLVVDNNWISERKHKDDNIDEAAAKPVVRNNLKWVRREAARKELNLDTKRGVFVLDAHAGKFKKLTENFMPTITRSRGYTGGYLLLRKGWRRFTTLDELAKLQGTRLDRLDLTGVSNPQLGGMIGNAMSRNVLDRLIPRILYASGSIRTLPRDKWGCGEFDW